MPLTSPGSYLPVTQEHINHWIQVNIDRGGTPATELKLKGGYSVTDLTNDRAALQTRIIAIEGANNARQIAANDRDLKKAALLPRLAQFRAGVQYHLRGTGFVGALPRIPTFNLTESRFLKPFDDMADLWNKINAASGIPDFTPPLTLLSGYNLAGFSADLAALRTTYITVSNADESARLGRKERDVLLPPLKKRLQEYQAAIRALYGAGHPFFTSLPALSPPRGATPAPVNAAILWDPAQSQAVLTWSASADPHLASYQVRTSPGATYDTGDETVLATLPPGTLTYATDSGLIAPGATAVFKVYVVLDTGNEKGSKVLKVTRPAS